MPDRQTEQTALERINRLFSLAEETFPINPDRAQEYVELAKRIAMHTRVRLPRELRRRICPNCNAFLVPGSTSRTRIRQRREPHIAITCLRCGATNRIPIRREKT